MAFAEHSIIESWRRWWRWILLVVASKVEVIIIHLVFRNIVRSEDVTNVESELYNSVTSLILHLLLSNELQDASSDETSHQSEGHGDQHGSGLEPSLPVAGPDQLFRAVIVFIAGVREWEDLVETSLFSIVELIVLLWHSNPSQQNGEDPSHHSRHPVEVVNTTGVRDLQLGHQQWLQVSVIVEPT